jgi:hypothetical protein
MKYRIKEVKSPSYRQNMTVEFCIQRRVLGIWYNPLNVNADITGWYETLEEAKEMVRILTTKSVVVKYHNI